MAGVESPEGGTSFESGAHSRPFVSVLSMDAPQDRTYECWEFNSEFFATPRTGSKKRDRRIMEYKMWVLEFISKEKNPI